MNGRLAVRNRIIEHRVVRARDLLPNPRAYRRHPERQRRILSAYVYEVGWLEPVVVREGRDGSLVIIDGALRARIDPEAMIPVVITDLTEAEEPGALIMLDSLPQLAHHDPRALKDLLGEVDASSQAVREMADRLARRAGLGLLLGLELGPVPPLPTEPRTKPGDLYALGAHRLLCGDARSPQDLATLMGDELAQAVWTDPPYGVRYEGKTPRRLRIAGDRADGLERLLSEAFAAMDSVLHPGAHLYVAHPDGELAFTFMACFVAQGWRLHQGLVWDKGAPVLGHSDYLFAHEPILYGYKRGPGRLGRGGPRWFGGNDQSSVLAIPKPHASREHPTMKPPELIRRHLANSSKEGDAVLDPFLGSGSTLIACESLGRRCFGMDIDPRYVDVAIERWERLTGKEAKHVQAHERAARSGRGERSTPAPAT